MEGFMGRVELGSMIGSQFAAGRSYHGAEASPCMDGRTKGASRAKADDAAVVDFCALSLSLVVLDSADFDPSTTAARRESMTASEKYSSCCHSCTRSRSFFSCLGALVNAAALLNKAASRGAASVNRLAV